MKNPKAKGLAAVLGSVAAAAALYTLTPAFEGRELTTYRDLGGVLTYCDGATENAQWGKTYTPAQCNAQLDRDLARHAEGIKPCLPWARLTDGQKIAYVDAAFNIGVTNFCGSSMARHTKAGNDKAGCDALLAWNGVVKPVKQPDGTVKRVKVVYRGLDRRRRAEREICLKGLP